MPFRWKVLGLGNLLKRDDGFGPRFIEYLKREDLSSRVDLLDLGTGAADLLSLLSFNGGIIILDALQGGGGEPGDLYLLESRELLSKYRSRVCGGSTDEKAGDAAVASLSYAPSIRFNLHAADILEIITQASYCYGDRMASPLYLLSVEVSNIDWGTEMTSMVKESLPRARELVLKILQT